MDKGQNFQGTNKSLKISSWTLLEVCFHQHKKVFLKIFGLQILNFAFKKVKT